MSGSTSMKFDYSQAEQLSKSISTNATQTRNIILQAGRDIESTRDFWVGPSAEAYVAEFKRLAPKMELMVKCIDDISTQLKKISEAHKQSESEIAQAINSMK